VEFDSFVLKKEIIVSFLAKTGNCQFSVAKSPLLVGLYLYKRAVHLQLVAAA